MTTVICRSPYRVSLGGGGTDLPSYYQQHGGFFISAAIQQYLYISLTQQLTAGYQIQAPELQQVQEINQITHPLIREALCHYPVDRVALNVMADLPGQSGMGSSGSFLVTLLKALHEARATAHNAGAIAEQAFDIEYRALQRPVGKQDQYIAAFGGIKVFEIDINGVVTARDIQISAEAKAIFANKLVLFYTGKQRESSSILKEQQRQSEASDSAMLDNLHQVKALGLASYQALEAQRFDEFGQLLHEHWQIKQQRAKQMSDNTMNALYEYALSNGALGGKLIGAGGGGFFMFYCQDKPRLIEAMANHPYPALDIAFDEEGVKRLC